MVKKSSVPVRLLKDVPKYGQKGSIVPIPQGRMRNEWYPTGRAEYVTSASLKALGDGNVTIERDFNFGQRHLSDSVLPDASMNGATRVEAEVALLGPVRSTQILSSLVPATIEFYRPMISSSPRLDSVASGASQEPVVSSGANGTASHSEGKGSSGEPAGIYGSVSAADVVNSLRTILANDREGSRVVLGPEDVTLSSAKLDRSQVDRVKHLGEFQVEIRPKGSAHSVQRTVVVKGEDGNRNL
ncbi:MAG: hypothetical protein M1833_004931 [Piccolia ochrophora]|nr:MAG: hypothetical protein M1833_004931 [Piccolia ochrophora]